jgi:polyisoprenoid-binding protein YceI
VILLGGAFICLSAAVRANTADDTLVGVNQGTISFEVATNVPALRVHGKSTSLAARARVGLGPDGFVVEQIEAIVPVRSLETGMALRDDHMRRYIFTTAGGDIPDVQFSGDRAECATSDRRRATCTVSGALTIRGTAKPFVMTVTISEENGTVRAAGSGIVKLSDYGIEQPSQLGVRTTDEVKLKLELTARRSSSVAASSHTGAR